MWGRVTGCRLCVVEVGDLLEDDAVAVELVRDVSVALDERRHLEPEARQQPHLAEEADEAVGEVDAEQLVGVVAVDLHQLPRELHRQPGRVVLAGGGQGGRRGVRGIAPELRRNCAGIARACRSRSTSSHQSEYCEFE